MSTQKNDMVIDIGNTRMKVALFVKGELDGVLTFSNRAYRQVSQLIDKAGAKRGIISNVSKMNRPLADVFEENLELIQIDQNTKFPISIDYRTPETLGTDRIANAVAAAKLYPNRNVLVIDFGTCIKYDIVTSKGVFVGGAIAPGVQMRFKSMYMMTGKLPRIKEWEAFEEDWPGKDTRSSMVSGVVQGITAEVLRYIDVSNEHYHNLTVIATGGDFGFFDKLFKNIIFAHPYLTLWGLHEILLTNMD
jgi:type III pantothenate kinase